MIEVKVRGQHLTKDNRNAGVQHEANVTFLRIDFDEGWDGYAKTVTFWNALMGNPTKILLTTDKLEDITASPRIYIAPIPGEATDEAGDMTFVIDGYAVAPLGSEYEYLTLAETIEEATETITVENTITLAEAFGLVGRKISVSDEVYTVLDVTYDGSDLPILKLSGTVSTGTAGDKIYAADGARKRSLSDTLWVKEAPIELDASEPAEPSPTIAEQMQVQIDTIIHTIADATQAAADAQSNADFSLLQARTAGEHAQDAANQASNAWYSRQAAETAQAAAAASEAAAKASETNAAASETNAAASARTATTGANTATTKASEAASSASTASTKAGEAATSATNAKASEENAAIYRTGAYDNAVIAMRARDAAAASETNAEASATAAAQSAAEAKQAAGGDFVTPAQAQAMADAAKSAANNYTDEQIAAIPTPDVSGQINAHNASSTAHTDMRTELAAVERAKTGGEIDTRLSNRVEKTGDTMTGILTFDTPGLFSAFQKKRTIGSANYIMRAGIGNDGNGASVCLRLFSVADDGTETAVSHIEADSSGVYWVAPGGVRKTIAHSGNIGVLTASVE